MHPLCTFGIIKKNAPNIQYMLFPPKNALLSMGKKCTVKKETTRMRNFHLARKLLEKAECLLPRFRGEHGNPILMGLAMVIITTM